MDRLLSHFHRKNRRVKILQIVQSAYDDDYLVFLKTILALQDNTFFPIFTSPTTSEYQSPSKKELIRS